MSKKAEEFFNLMIGPGVSVFEIMEAYKNQEESIYNTDGILSGPPIKSYPEVTIGDEKNKIFDTVAASEKFDALLKDLTPEEVDRFKGLKEVRLDVAKIIKYSPLSNETDSWIFFNEDLESKFDGKEFLVCIAVPSGHAYEVAEWTEDEDFKRFATRHRDYCHRVIKYKHIN